MSRGWNQAAVTPRASRRPSPVFLLLVLVMVVTGWLAWTGRGPSGLVVFGFVIAGWVVSLCLHEYAHAISAYRSGDRSVAERGYLTLNPFRYTHPVLSIVIPVVLVLMGGIGLPGGAVWIDHGAIRGRLRDSLISLAGPLTNLACVVLLLLPLRLGADTLAHASFWGAVAFLAFLQLTAAVLNLLPLPGVDGGNALFPWLNDQWRRAFAMMAPYGMLVLFVLLMTPQLNALFFGGVFALGSVLGLPTDLVAQGFRDFPSLGSFVR
jgi:Zn-dependent protease